MTDITLNDDYFVIVNPMAGSRHLHQNWSLLKSALDRSSIQYRFQFTEYRQHAIDIVQQALNRGYRKFVVVGGDGTTNEVVNGLYQQQLFDVSQCELAVVPWGTGNDWAAYYKLPKKVDDIIGMLQSPANCLQDLGVVTYKDKLENRQHYFLNFVGAGYDSYLLTKMGSGQGDRYRYLFYVVRCLKSYVAPVFKLDVSGKQLIRPALMLIACIGRYGGAGMKFAPSAKADDGLFNILNIGDMHLVKRVMSLIYLFNGRVNQHPQVKVWESDCLAISADSPTAFQCDGEVIGQLPIEVNLLPRAIKILTP